MLQEPSTVVQGTIMRIKPKKSIMPMLYPSGHRDIPRGPTGAGIMVWRRIQICCINEAPLCTALSTMHTTSPFEGEDIPTRLTRFPF